MTAHHPALHVLFKNDSSTSCFASMQMLQAVQLRARLAAPRWPRHASHSLAGSASCRASHGATSQGVASRHLGIRPTSETVAICSTLSTSGFTIWDMLCCQAELYRRAVHLYAVCCSHGSRPESRRRCVSPTEAASAGQSDGHTTKPRLAAIPRPFFVTRSSIISAGGAVAGPDPTGPGRPGTRVLVPLARRGS